MKESEQFKLPVGLSTFEVIRAADYVYVDKTDKVYELAKENKRYFLVRPRRFGKSLLISTFESLFAHGTKFFKGLALEPLWNDRTYRVVWIDFSTVAAELEDSTFDERLYSKLNACFGTAGFKYDSSRQTEFMVQLSEWLSKQSADPLVILIDEYDVPLTQCLEKTQKAAEISEALSSFYAVLKANDQSIRFLFITGILKISLFAGMENLEDISFRSEYADLLGFTQQEVETSFAPFLNSAGQALALSHKELFEAIKARYDGYSFEKTAAMTVYPPWSILKFFKRPDDGFESYWYESGSSSIIQTYVKAQKLGRPEDFNKPVLIPFAELYAPVKLPKLNLFSLLTYTGYLTIKGQQGDLVQLNYPNKEVSESLSLLYIGAILPSRYFADTGIGLLQSNFQQGYVDKVIACFNRVLLQLSYQQYPIENESVLRGFIQMLLTGCGLDVLSEHHNTFGRTDLEIRAGGFVWVLELKYAQSNDQVEHLLNLAKEQCRKKHYGEHLPSKALIRVALVFSRESKILEKYSRC